MAPLEIRHRSVRPISAKHAQASRFLQQSRQGRSTGGCAVSPSNSRRTGSRACHSSATGSSCNPCRRSLHPRRRLSIAGSTPCSRACRITELLVEVAERTGFSEQHFAICDPARSMTTRNADPCGHSRRRVESGPGAHGQCQRRGELRPARVDAQLVPVARKLSATHWA
jgi:hypothetical protein